MNTENKSTELNDTDKKLHISDVSGSFTKKDLFEAFSHYAFASISNQPYNEEEFEKWFKCKCQK